jgi:hypothetical protein
MVPGGWIRPQWRKPFLHVFILEKKSLKPFFPESAGKLGKTILDMFFNKDNIINKSSQDLLHQMSSDLHRNFMFKCRNEFHIMPWPPEIGWNNNKENYFCRWLHREN